MVEPWRQVRTAADFNARYPLASRSHIIAFRRTGTRSSPLLMVKISDCPGWSFSGKAADNSGLKFLRRESYPCPWPDLSTIIVGEALRAAAWGDELAGRIRLSNVQVIPYCVIMLALGMNIANPPQQQHEAGGQHGSSH